MSAPTRVCAVVPVKPSGAALRRLAGMLDARARRELQAAMLDDVLAALAAARGVGEVLVVTADPEVAARVPVLGARVVPDHSPPRGMNAAVEIGLAEATRAGYEAALVLTADLPLASAAEIGSILAADAPERSVVLVPSRDGTGTNAMLIRPPDALRPHLGPDSRSRHLEHAHRAGVVARTLDLPGLALDIDLPDDLLTLVTSGAPCVTRSAWERASARAAAGSAL